MPYPFAHPAAVIPLARPMGRLAVPSALVIGSVVPDLWYFTPFVSRADRHSLEALAWFCLPVGLLAYAIFHLLLKQPLVALISARLGAFSTTGLPDKRWHAVVTSLLVGAATHLAWDALTHEYAIHGVNWLQHASTALGTLVIAWWVWRKLQCVPPAQSALSARLRVGVWAVLAAAAALGAALEGVDAPTLRLVARGAGMAALQACVLAIFVYCAAWHLRAKRTTSA